MDNQGMHVGIFSLAKKNFIHNMDNPVAGFESTKKV